MFRKKRRHIIVLGRVSEQIHDEIIAEFGEENVISADVSKFKDQEAYFALYRDPQKEGGFKKKTPEQIKEIVDAELVRRHVYDAQMKGAEITFVSSASGDNISARGFSMLFSLPLFKRQKGAVRVNAVEPYTPFMRNDKEFWRQLMNNGEVFAAYPQDNAISCAYYSEYLKAGGADTHTGFTPHSSLGEEYFERTFGYTSFPVIEWIFDRIPFANQNMRDTFNHAARKLGRPPKSKFVSTSTFFATQFREDEGLATDLATNNIIIGAPDGGNKMDDEGIARAVDLRNALLPGTAPENPRQDPNMFFITKHRKGEGKTEITNFEVGSGGTVKDKVAIIKDDIIGSGSTLFDAARELKMHGAKKVIADVTHGVLVNSAIDKVLDNEDLDEVWISDSIPSTVDKLEDFVHELKQALQADLIDEMAYSAKLDRLTKIKVKSMAPLIVEQIRRLHQDHNLAFENEISQPQAQTTQKQVFQA